MPGRRANFFQRLQLNSGRAKPLPLLIGPRTRLSSDAEMVGRALELQTVRHYLTDETVDWNYILAANSSIPRCCWRSLRAYDHHPPWRPTRHLHTMEPVSRRGVGMFAPNSHHATGELFSIPCQFNYSCQLFQNALFVLRETSKKQPNNTQDRNEDGNGGDWLISTIVFFS